MIVEENLTELIISAGGAIWMRRATEDVAGIYEAGQ